jgi:hypothetical protein
MEEPDQEDSQRSSLSIKLANHFLSVSVILKLRVDIFHSRHQMQLSQSSSTLIPYPSEAAAGRFILGVPKTFNHVL